MRATGRRSLSLVLASMSIASALVFVGPRPAIAAGRQLTLGELGGGERMAVGDHCVFVGSLSDPGHSIFIVDRGSMTIASSIAGLSAGGLLAQGSDLYVSIPAAGRIDQYAVSEDCTSYATTQHSVAPADTVTSMTWAADAVWFRGIRNTTVDVLGRLDASGDVTTWDISAGGLGAVPAAPSSLWGFGTGGIKRLDISSDPPNVVASGGPSPSPYDSFPISSDADTIWAETVCTGDPGIWAWDASSLTSIPGCVDFGGDSVQAYAADPARDRLAVVTHENFQGLSLHVLSGSSSAFLFSQELEIDESAASKRTLSFSPTGDALYLVTRDPFGVRTLWEYPGDPQPSGLAIVAPTRVTFGDEVDVVVHLGSFAQTSNDTVRVYVEPFDEARTLVLDQAVDGAGNVSFSFSATKNTTVSVEWDGDDGHPAHTIEQAIPVQAIVKGKLSRYYDTKGKYKLYRPGSPQPYLVRVRPNHAGSGVTIDLDRYRRGRWRDAAYRRFELDARSRLLVVVTNAQADTRYRIRAAFGDLDHAGAFTRWSYFLLR